MIQSSALEFGVDEAVICAIAESESHFDPKAKSSAGAIGIMQLMPETALWIAANLCVEDYKEDSLYLPEVNIRFGAWYLAYLFSVFDESWQVYAAYNAGEGTVKEWLETENFAKDDIPYPETAQYVRRVERAVKRYTKKKLLAFN